MDSLKIGFLSLVDSLRGDESLFNGSAMTRRGAFAAISYMASAVMLIIFNKAALSSFHFPSGNVITICQIICSCSFLCIMRRWKIISFTAGRPLNESDDSADLVPFKTLVQTLPIALSYLLYMAVSMESVRGINAPMYTTLRRTGVVFQWLWNIFCPGKIIHFLFSAGKSLGLNSFGLIWCNGIISGPILLFWTFFCGDLEKTIEYPFLYVPAFQAVMLLSCIMAFLLNYFLFMNTILNSALTQSICANLNDFFTIILGWLIFGGLPFDPLNVIGQCIGFAGACFYAYCKLREKQ